MAEACRHPTIFVAYDPLKPNYVNVGTCQVCGAEVPMYSKPQQRSDYWRAEAKPRFFWSEFPGDERSETHPANKPEVWREVLPRWYEQRVN